MSDEPAKAVKSHPAFRPTGSSRAPSIDGPLLSIDGGDDLVAAALAAVDARRGSKGHRASVPRSAAPQTSLPPASVPQKSVSAAPSGPNELTIQFDPNDLSILESDNGPFEDDILVGGGELSSAEPSAAGGVAPDAAPHGVDGAAMEALVEEVERFRVELAQSRERIGQLEDELTREVLERKKAAAILLRANDRIQRAEHAARLSVDARIASEEAAKNAREALERAMSDVKRLQERRRAEVEDARRFAASPLLLELFPVMDNLQMALIHSAADPGRVLQGVQMIADQLRRLVDRSGAQRIVATPGIPFQPELHEAMQRVHTDEQPEGSIHEELSAGYTLHGRLLRAARVSVAVPSLTAERTELTSSQGPDTDGPNRLGTALP